MNNIAVVIPCYKVADTIEDVISQIPQEINHIIVVDDGCPDFSGRYAEQSLDKRVIVLRHTDNLGVGGATITGYKKAVELDCDIIVKIDGDGQMDADYITELVEPIIQNKADYTKGNRFFDYNILLAMPLIRLIGNSILTFIMKLVSGYWDIKDPTNGFTAIHKKILKKLNLNKIDRSYFFESDMLINLNIINAVVHDVDIPSRYGHEKSSLNILSTIIVFPFKHFRGLLRRVLIKYYITDINIGSAYLLFGALSFLFGVLFGLRHWIFSREYGVFSSAGTVMLSALPVFIGVILLIQAITVDIKSVPTKKDK
jgi:glycosyltransferase involved in cell wall biosynthesis